MSAVNNYWTRRDFIGKSSAACFSTFLSGHLQLTCQPVTHPKNEDNLLREIHLTTKTSLDEMVDFYNGGFGFDVMLETEFKIGFQIGLTQVYFSKVNVVNAPHYHIAFNIPENKIQHAESWHLKNYSIIQPPEHLLDQPNYSENIVYFRHWDAHSIFFYDPAGNLLEYIARHTLNNPSTSSSFSPTDILYASEIGFVVKDVNTWRDKLMANSSLTAYANQSNSFGALGDEHGLVLLFSDQGRAVFNRGRKRDIYKTQVRLRANSNMAKGVFASYPYAFI